MNGVRTPVIVPMPKDGSGPTRASVPYRSGPDGYMRPSDMTPPDADTPLQDGPEGPSRGLERGQSSGERQEQTTHRDTAGGEVCKKLSSILEPEINTISNRSGSHGWRPELRPQKVRVAADVADVPADAPGEQWHGHTPIQREVLVPDWHPKSINIRGYDERDFVGPLESTTVMFSVDRVWYPISARPSSKWWRFWENNGTLEFAFALVVLLILIMIVLLCTGGGFWNVPPLQRRIKATATTTATASFSTPSPMAPAVPDVSEHLPQ